TRRCRSWHSRRGTRAGSWLPAASPDAPRGPPLRPAVEGTERTQEVASLRGEPVPALGRELDDPHRAQLGEPGVQHARRHGVTAPAPDPEAERVAAELPEDAECPAPAEEIEHHHHRPPRPGAPHRTARSWYRHLPDPPCATFFEALVLPPMLRFR